MGRRGQNTMGREGVQYILIIMGREVIKFPNFPKIYIFKKFQYFKKLQNFHRISKLTYFIRLKKIKKKFKIFIEFFNFFFKISKFVYHESDIFLKIGFAEIPYINKGLLVYLVFSMGIGVNIPWVGGVD